MGISGHRGGVPQTICEITHIHGPSWGDDIIVMGAVRDGSLYSVDPAAGELQTIKVVTNWFNELERSIPTAD